MWGWYNWGIEIERDDAMTTELFDECWGKFDSIWRMRHDARENLEHIEALTASDVVSEETKEKLAPVVHRLNDLIAELEGIALSGDMWITRVVSCTNIPGRRYWRFEFGDEDRRCHDIGFDDRLNNRNDEDSEALLRGHPAIEQSGWADDFISLDRHGSMTFNPPLHCKVEFERDRLHCHLIWLEAKENYSRRRLFTRR